jgi:serpin B
MMIARQPDFVQKMLHCLLALVLSLSLLSACTPGSIEPVPVARAAPAATVTQLAELTEGNTAFAFELYQALRTETDGNFVWSPYSISLALAMAYAGARGATEQQLASTLHYGLSQEQLHPAFNALTQELTRRGEGMGSTDGQGFRLNVANALWVQEDVAFRP